MQTNVYASGKAKHGLRKHAFRNTNAEDHVHWDGIIIRNNNKNMSNCWGDSKENAFDPIIVNTMSFSRWLTIKWNLKLYNAFKELEKHKERYDPSQKYRKVWDAMSHNVNAFMKKGGTDITIDETTWPSA